MADFPTSLDTLTNPSAGNATNSPSHAAQHSDANDSIEALEAKLGIGASTPASGKFLRGTGAGSSAWDKDAPTGTVVGTTDTQTLTNKTLTSPTINGGAINNPSFAIDTITESTPAAGVTVDGVLLKDGVIPASAIPTDSVDDNKLDLPRWWQEIGRTTLAVTGDTITVSGLPARKYLMIVASLLDTGGTINGFITFNNDSAANYAVRASVNGAADTTGASGSNISLAPSTGAFPLLSFSEIVNIQASEKLVTGHSVNRNTAGAANLPERREFVGKWANTAAQITRIDITNGGTGDYAIGSQVVILGHD